MRYGIVREGSSLPPAAAQRRLLEAAACDVILQEGHPTPEAQRRLARLLFGLKPGDEVLAHSLDVFQRTTGELAQMIRTFLEVGVSLHIMGEDADGHSLTPSEAVLQVLSLLADHEVRRPSRTPNGASSLKSGSRNLLSKYQLDYARKLYREGASLRSIGLLFQVSPSEVWEAIGD
ncbi:recombinase family protein [Phenylobacterium sp. J426]|uniref:recombinase family protein n=1 Tax=Phenylobacterium sp. J426 TaxID=2898439 RepID=UPI002151AF61|nr:recombinase family protein [Phenylobacterium sp. J426]MCR5874065.1 recombinase family protein [Phenylobacterium sp. J426]